jgi:hypothetical protein
LTFHKLHRQLGATSLDAVELRRLVDALAGQGLVVCTGRRVALPE